MCQILQHQRANKCFTQFKPQRSVGQIASLLWLGGIFPIRLVRHLVIEAVSTISAAKSPKVTPQTAQTAFSTNITSVKNFEIKQNGYFFKAEKDFAFQFRLFLLLFDLKDESRSSRQVPEIQVGVGVRGVGCENGFRPPSSERRWYRQTRRVEEPSGTTSEARRPRRPPEMSGCRSEVRGRPPWWGRSPQVRCCRRLRRCRSRQPETTKRQYIFGILMKKNQYYQ